jgi:predicted nucleic acid-binding Zn ribbon protein
MPVYVYRNLTTGATFEVEQRISAPALTTDPTTGDPVKRVIQPVGIAFKGSGFYVNDSRGKRAASAPAKAAEAPGAAKADAPAPAATTTSTPSAATASAD